MRIFILFFFSCFAALGNTNVVDMLVHMENLTSGTLLTSNLLAQCSITNGNNGYWLYSDSNNICVVTNFNGTNSRGPVIVNGVGYNTHKMSMTNSMVIDYFKTNNTREYGKFVLNPKKNKVSVGFAWAWNGNNAADFGSFYDTFALEGDSGDFIVQSIVNKPPGTGADSQVGIETQACFSGAGYTAFTNAQFYWTTILWDAANTKGRIMVYDMTTWALLMTNGCTLVNTLCNGIFWGRYDDHPLNDGAGVMYMDNLVVDFSGAQFPLLPIGANIAANSTTWTDVSNACLRTVTGGNNAISDIVRLPSSSNQWTGTLKVTNTLGIIGSGTNSSQSVIRFSGLSQNVGLDVSADFVHLRDFQFRGVPGKATDGWGIEINSNNCSISNLYMQDFLSPIVSHSVFGVVYNSHFRNSQRVPGRVQCRGGDNNWTLYAPFNGNSGYSQTNFFTVEDCRFTIDSAMDLTAPVQVALSSQEGSMWVMRRCFGDFSNTSYQFAPLYDSHGETDPGLRGNIAIQIYSNVFNVAAGIFPEIDKFVDIRGGAALVYSNRVIGVTTQSGVYMRKKDGETADYNNDPVTNVWIFANLEGVGGNTAMPATVEANDASIIVLHTHFETTAPTTLYEVPYPHPLRNEVAQSGGGGVPSPNPFFIPITRVLTLKGK